MERIIAISQTVKDDETIEADERKGEDKMSSSGDPWALLKERLEEIRLQLQRDREETEQKYPEELRSGMACISDHLYSEDLSVVWLVGKCGVNQRKLSMLFEKYTGKKPVDYWNNMRVEAAKEILSDERFRELKLSALAVNLGYTPSGNFRQAFKARTGMTPAEWRNEHLS